MNEQLMEYFNEIEKHHWWWEGRRQILRQVLARKRNTRILDIGCGTGETMTFLSQWLDHPFIVGVDNSQQATSYAKARGHTIVAQVDALTLPFLEHNFDHVLLLDVMEHIKDDLALLVEVSRVTHSGSKIIITVPALEFLWSSHDSSQGHYRRYTRAMLSELITKAGLKIERLSYFNFIFSLPIMIIRLLSRIKILGWLGNYDNPLNYSIANRKILNEILKFAFLVEIKGMRFLNYPWGISLCCILSKQE